MDLSKLSDSDLEAIASGDMSKASDSALGYIASGGKESYAPKQSYEDFKKAFIADQATTGYKIKEGAKDFVRKTIPYVRPTVEGLGGVGGGLLGGVAGIETGPGAVLSGAAGAGLGYSAAKTGLDTLEEWLGGTPNAERLANRSVAQRMTEPVYDAALGSTMEVGGQLIAPAVGELVRAGKGAVGLVTKPKETLSNVAKIAAAKRVEDAATKTGRVAQRAAENKTAYNELANQMTGYRLTPAAATDDPALLRMQQKIQFDQPDANALLESQKMGNREAIQNYMNSQLPQGSMDDFVKELDAQIAARGQNSLTEANRLASGDKEVLSANMQQLEQQVQWAMKAKADALYGQVPRGMEMDSTPLYRKLQELQGQLDPAFADPRNMPSTIINKAEGGLAPKPSGILGSDGMPYNAPRMAQDIPEKLTYEQLMQYNNNVTSALRQAKSTGNFSQAANLAEIKNSIQQTLKFAEETGQGQSVRALRDANKFYRESYVPTVRQGQFGKNSAVTSTGERRVADEISAGKYLQTGDNGLAAANDFNRAFKGNTEATNTLRDYAKRDLYDHITANGTEAPSLQKAQKWIADRMPALKKLGMDAEFDGLTGALKAQEEVSAFGKVLNTADPQEMLKSLFTANGPRQNMKSMMDLATLVKGNEAATNGLKKSFSDMMMKQSELVKEVGGNPVISDAKMKAFWEQYEPAMKMLYSKDEMKALSNVRDAFKMENRLGRSTTGVDNSNTAAHLDNTIGQGVARSMPILSQTGRMARFGIELLMRAKKSGASDYVMKAQFDPQVAKELQDILYKSRSEAEVRRAIGAAVAKTTGFWNIDQFAR